MKKKLLSAVMLCALGLMGCGGEEEPIDKPPPVPKFDTADNIRTYLEGKKLLMEAANIPSHPNGLDEDVNFDTATQCYQKVEMAFSGGNFQVTSTLGTLRDAPARFSRGTCDHAVVNGTPQVFTSNAVLIENVATDATCFDITITYTGFKQVGRGNMSADGKTLTLELFFEGGASGANCAAGPVGSPTVIVNQTTFTGNAKQVYVVSAQ
jgi:hypothetical protein